VSLLIGGTGSANQFSRISTGNAAGNGLMVHDPYFAPYALQPVQPTINPTQPGQAVGKFRRHLNGLTTDASNNALSGATVLAFYSATDTLLGTQVSDAQGNYDFPIYAEGLTFWLYANKAGSPEVFGATSDQVVPI